MCIYACVVDVACVCLPASGLCTLSMFSCTVTCLNYKRHLEKYTLL